MSPRCCLCDKRESYSSTLGWHCRNPACSNDQAHPESDLTEVPDLMGKLDAAIAVVRADERERVLADAKARIEDINIEHHVMPHRHDEYALFEVALNCALAALTQPQTEIEGKPDGTWYDIPDGGGAATAAGVADAEHERRLETNRLLWNRVARLEEALRVIRGTEDRGPWMLIYRNAGGGYAGLQAIAETALAPEDSEPSPYAKAFRERVCPVPEFPGIEKEES